MMRWLPENVSTYGADIDYLFYLIYYITAAVFILVTVLLVAFLIMYRHREGRRATYTHGNATLELAWTVTPAVILVVLAFMSASKWSEIKVRVPPSDFRVQVTGKQFNWEMLYPGPDGEFGTEDDLLLENDMHVPVNKVVLVILRSEDVIHSFFLPHLRLKQDALPGREIIAWFEATKPGRYEIPCAELCGFGHSGMKGWLTVDSAEDYQKWVQERWPSTISSQPSAVSVQLKG
jgi:cytochrome c oxidase subunit 2